MKYLEEICVVRDNPQELEALYQSALNEKEAIAFREALLQCYEETPDDLLLAAWFCRLQQTAPEVPEKSRRGVNWTLAIPLSILTGLIFWVLSDFDHLMLLDHYPHLVLWWSPIATMSALIFLTVTARKNYVRSVVLGAGLFLTALYVILLTPGLEGEYRLIGRYLDVAAIHIPLLCWTALGIYVLGFGSKIEDRFAFLVKSVEVVITAGLYLIAGMVFSGITVGMFEALNISLPEIWMRLIAAGGFGLLPILAVATIYDPTVAPSKQDFSQGLSKFIATMMHLLLPLTLGVLVIYIFVIPFNFMEPFQNRDVLIIYNLMLFAIMGLLLGATPIRPADLSPKLQTWLRSGIIAAAILAVLISLYAMSATVYRTVQGGITINRLTIIGWNSINIGILACLIYNQFKDGREKWVASLQKVLGYGTNAYVVWSLFLVVAIPLLFR